MTTETESYQDQYARAWHHKQQLNHLNTFTEQLDYWINNIDPNPEHGGGMFYALDVTRPDAVSAYKDNTEGGSLN